MNLGAKRRVPTELVLWTLGENSMQLVLEALKKPMAQRVLGAQEEEHSW